ncbi:2-desacetyl-2-hydroxyethyl bacteriochlorophyllide A dehydrogenase [Sporobacter termitidis DSM 10068]|uniref:2-desacetyl-2-hydroxyethyl bacteriochlorophyllide A dehydrogenase n=1 Tax=Sporobacter termitidis DSM 10068 TaxID=1123282 RepID=A0A1M5YRX7_9FIRM|nr:alcohol dehydrogenase catalytic domain-containing protein [Sporobacter termitidis]SHI14590.1 2-desacetyl-2-hydroxyethyl bacteriochlorophyllide A dehydrogenase [Sporobacter termitidis DSM 10068]
MKAVCMYAPGEIGLTEIDMPVRKPEEALIRVRAAGICGSDIGAFRGTNNLVTYPRIIGHEIAGEIVEVGDNSRGLKPGSRVILDPYLYCGHCYPCSLGRTNCCEDLKVLGVHVDGGMAEYITHPSNMLVPVPDGLRWEHIPLAEPMTIALHAIHRTKLKAGEHIAINGAGAIGILIAMCALAYGAMPILIDIVQERLDFARRLGIDYTIDSSRQDLLKTISDITSGRMAEVVAEASGANQAIRSTLYMVSYAGRIALTGWPKNETPLPTDMITKKELDIVGSRTSAGEFAEAVALMTTGRVNAQAVLSKVVAFGEIPGMVRELSEYPDRYLKVNAVI